MSVQGVAPVERRPAPKSSLRVLPDDEHNRELLSHVHPEHWVNPRARGRYNLVVIGGGTAGLVSAMGAAGLGARVALIERHLLGGGLRFARAVIATGARAAVPPIDGLEEAGFLTNETVFSLTALPRRLAVIGAGPIGCELAQAFQRLGSAVTLLSMDSRVLPREDPDASALLHEQLAAEGVALALGVNVTGVRRTGAGKALSFDGGHGVEQVEVDDILVAVGRSPNIEGLGLETAGVEVGRSGGEVEVDDRLRTANPRIYAAGDICSRYKFTHAADAMARIVIQNALFMGRSKVSSLVIPWATYTDPEIAHVGLYEHEAKERGLSVQTFSVPLRDIDRAVVDGETTGFARMHVDDRSGCILGATVVARHAGEMIGEMALAVTQRLSAGALTKTVHPYPTQAEVYKRLGDAYNRTRLKPWIKRLFERYLSWRR